MTPHPSDRSVVARSRLVGGLLTLVLGAVVLSGAPKEITVDRLNTADSDRDNWMVYGGTYRSLRYSPLDQITPSNVGRLKVDWAYQLGIIDHGLQSTPVVADGVLYLIGSDHRLVAIDAATGRQIWRYTYERQVRQKADEKATRVVDTVRGVALGHGNVYFGTDDNFVVAVNQTTGKEVWRTNVEDKETFGCSMRAAPLVVNDIVVVGSRGGDTAHRGHLVAFDAVTGKQRWWFNVIPGPGEKGNETWEGDSWKYGGGAPWLTGSYDPALDLIYWGTSNTSSDFYGGHRKGDNLYTNSIVALKAKTGELAWYYQTIPHDVWDYDAVYEIMLVDLPINGKPRQLLIQPNKNGFVYVLDRTNGTYITSFKYADLITWTSGLDAKGIPQNRKEPQLETPTLICPNFFGSRSWNQATYSPKTGLLYNVAVEWCGEFTARVQQGVPGKSWLGGTMKLVPPPSGKVTSHLDAFEPLTGKRVWRVETKHPVLSALLSTGGELLFVGDPEGYFTAYHARTGQKLWAFNTGSGHRGGPIAYGLNGRQYVVTPSGWGSTLAGRLGEFFPELVAAPPGATLFAFTLPDGTR